MIKKLIPIYIEDEMKTSYIDYSMSVIVSRALPDVRDGLKPVHRRVLFGMHELGMLSNRPYKKSARVVGEVLAKYHPHGDNSVYDAMVRMAQKWSLRYCLIDGQGNFGSIDGDAPAAMRYTEARLQNLSEEMLTDIEKGTVDYQLNFDDSLEEPSVLPASFPNLLVNGSSGIAVGMATNIAPHNIKECIEAICAYIDNTAISIDELMQYIKAPDFPTGGIIYGYQGVKEAFHTGRGCIILRAKTRLEKIKHRECIIVEEIPYQVNKGDLLVKTSYLIKIGKLEGVANIRDESDREGMRIVYVLKQNAGPEIVLNNLFKETSLQISFHINNVALVKGKPMQINLKDMIRYFVDHRHEVTIRCTQYDLKKAQDRSQILEGLLFTLSQLDVAVDLIKGSKTPDEASDKLIMQFKLTKTQVKAILDMRLQRFTFIEREKLEKEYNDLSKKVERFKEILDKEPIRMQIIKDKLLEIKEKYKDDRRTMVSYSGKEVTMKDLILNEYVVLTISHHGYIKRTPLSEYKRQLRGGIGNIGAKTRDEDFLEHLFVATNHQYTLFFTKKGKCFWLRVYEIPEGSKTSKGRAIQNLIRLSPDDRICAYILSGDLDDEKYIKNRYVIMVTESGIIKKTPIKKYSRPRRNGINAITIREKDTLLEAELTTGNSEVLIAVKSGKAIRFSEKKVRPMGRMACGVKGIRMSEEDDKVIGMVCVKPDNKEDILVVSEKGYGKRSFLENYSITNRGGKGVKTINITKKTGKLISITSVYNTSDLMIITKDGITIRISVSDIRISGRSTQGVRLINLREGDEIAAVAKVGQNKEIQ
ncbi:DNA gyrase subunit A [Candidatus Walczuchella monophlebidarum]|uniref:DNA gyrase subunit A n=1 Tax=Candidatus Walczuchella monophlebidarum TaxID=1415657 RepID=A0A068DRZ5_9FLAO|nr:DNA gyrase subunit A [Candidatus Walczuchella monophlebidarum]AID37391.1 DNA gyrase A subunit [Candidatus Walczuchella monophlebidarum]